MRRSFFLILTFIAAMFSTQAFAQIVNPVKWSIDLNMTDDTHGQIVMKATIQDGWHMYSNEVDPSVGPTPLSLTFSTLLLELLVVVLFGI